MARKASAELDKLIALKPGEGFTELCCTETGALFKEAGNYKEAEALLLKAYRASRAKKARQSMCGAAMHLADLYYRIGNPRLEKKHLETWGKITAGSGYSYFREMNYPALVRVCARCIEKGINTAYMERLISRYFGADNAVLMSKNPTQAAADPIAFISNCPTAPQKARTIDIKLFGGFRMTVDGVEIAEKEWKTRKISGILKYILANPGRTVSREALAALFWPESDPKAAGTSLRTSLYELRKTLSRIGLAFESRDALLAEGRNGFHLCGRDRIKTDTDRFTGFYEKYRSGKLSSGEIKTVLGQTVELYEGDFLEDDPYDEWIESSREHYRSIFIEVSHKLAGLYMADNDPEHAEALLVRQMKLDPLDEKACGMLIRLYEGTGRKSQAASLRRQFERRYMAELGEKPDFTW